MIKGFIKASDRNPTVILSRHPIITEGHFDLGWYNPARGYWVDEDGDSFGEVEWLDESPADGEAVYLHVDYNTLRTLEVDEDAIPRWEQDGSMEKGDRLYKANLIKTY